MCVYDRVKSVTLRMYLRTAAVKTGLMSQSQKSPQHLLQDVTGPPDTLSFTAARIAQGSCLRVECLQRERGERSEKERESEREREREREREKQIESDHIFVF